MDMTMLPSNLSIMASVRPLDEIAHIFDHQDSIIDVLKMDIEFGEWKVFEKIFATQEGRDSLSRVNQIALEVSYPIFFIA